MRKLTLADFESNGRWDCSHAFDADTFREAWRAIGRPTDPEAWISVCRRVEAEDFAESADWIAQQDGFDGLDPVACWESWKAGWLATAGAILRCYLSGWIEADLGVCEICEMRGAGNTCCP